MYRFILSLSLFLGLCVWECVGRGWHSAPPHQHWIVGDYLGVPDVDQLIRCYILNMLLPNDSVPLAALALIPSSCFLPVFMCFEFLTLAHQLCQHPATAHSHLSVLHSSPPQLSLQPLQSHQLFSLISPLHHLSLPWTLQYFNIKYTVTQIIIPPNRFGVCILPFAFLS